MGKVITIDLTDAPKGCAEHPLIRLKRLIKTVGADTVVKVITDDEVVPVAVIKTLAKSSRMDIKVTVKTHPLYEIVLKRRA